MSFVHLHGHSEYSLLDGLPKVKALVKRAKELRMESLAITDHGSMYGVIEFYKTCISEGVKPIIGCELYVAKRSHKDKEGKLDTEPYHLTVLAKNYQGYLNLLKLVTIGFLDGYYYRPRVDRELLSKYHEGLIVLSGCGASEFVRSLKDKDIKEAQKLAEDYLKIFGEGNYFFEVQNHEYERYLQGQGLDPAIRKDLEGMAHSQELMFEAIRALSPKMGIPIVATNDYHYINPDDAPAQDALVCVQTGKFISDINRLRMIDVPNFYLRSEEEMQELFNDLPEAIINSKKVADSVELELKLGKPIFPIFNIPDQKEPTEYLREICLKAFQTKFPNPTKEYQERLEYELSVIESKKFATYFLIFYDFVNWAHEHDVITNTRGSAAGSLVLYVLGITNMDPVAYMLPFERFMNPFRPKLPDIDCDIADDRRDEVIRYIMDRYGHDKVAHIVTFGTMMGRAAIRDIGRVLGLPYGRVDMIAKLVPPPKQGFHKTLDDALEESLDLKKLYDSDPEVKHLLDLAKKVEGTVRHASVHAAGVVIAPEPLTNYTPLQREANGDKIVTQYDMFSVTEDYEGVGLIKMDLLGIRNLSILGKSVEIVKGHRGIDVNLQTIPIDDAKTFELLGRGETMGLFQLEGDGMTRYLVELKPTNIFDIMAMIALYRPGPLAIIPEYITRKHDPKKVNYFDSRMKEYLERSLGLLVYQDDVLLTVVNIAGYSWEEVDKFRKAMGKKIPAEMAKQRDHFVEGCMKNGLSKERSEELFKLIEPFAAYGFNKAHAASYSMISYQTAYMKANYTVEFMAAVMTAEYGDTDKIAHAMEECKRLGIVVLPPDVNYSGVDFTIEDQAVRFGLSAIKNVGILAIESILQARKKGRFNSVSDLLSQVDTRLVNRKTLESLIKAGALDKLGKRSQLLAVLDACLERVHRHSKAASVGQASLFGEDEKVEALEMELPEIEELELTQLLEFEKDLLGFYLHEPPYLKSLNRLSDFTTTQIGKLSDEYLGQRVVIGGVIIDAKRVITKKSASEMAFVRLSDGVSEIEAVIFPKIFEGCKKVLIRDRVIVVTGRVDKREDQISLVADKVEDFDPQKLAVVEKELEITVPVGGDAELLRKINQTLRQHPGKAKVSLVLQSSVNSFRRMDLPFGVRSDPTLLQTISGLIGPGGAVRLT